MKFVRNDEASEDSTMSKMREEEQPVPLPEKSPFTLRARARSFVYAFQGVRALLLREHNAWLHLIAATAAGAAGWFFRISRVEWCLVAFAMGSVLAAEAFNTAIETLADAVAREQNPLVGKAKDLAAGGVLLTSVAAAMVGLIVFTPKLVQWVEQGWAQR